MEWKIGEIRQVNGEWYQCVEGNGCENCAFKARKCYLEGSSDDPIGECCYDRRRDNKDVLFKKLEKVGEPFPTNICGNNVWQQRYELYEPMATLDGYWYRIDGYFIDIELKQNKENMEEKNNVKQTPLEKLVIDFFNNRISDIEFEKRVSELYAEHSNSEKIGKNLKPFDLEAAKLGKPVCTRYGRKARIIYFDAKGDYPIVALIETGNGEKVGQYMIDGHCTDIISQCCDDLMMLPEKKEGWINVYKNDEGKISVSNTPYKTREEAFNYRTKYQYIDTVKITWEE